MYKVSASILTFVLCAFMSAPLMAQDTAIPGIALPENAAVPDIAITDKPVSSSGGISGFASDFVKKRIGKVTKALSSCQAMRYEVVGYFEDIRLMNLAFIFKSKIPD